MRLSVRSYQAPPGNPLNAPPGNDRDAPGASFPCDNVEVRSRSGIGRVDGESQAPEVVRMAGFVAGGGDADTAGRSGDALGLAEIVAELLVDRLLDAAVFIRAQQLRRQHFRS